MEVHRGGIAMSGLLSTKVEIESQPSALRDTLAHVELEYTLRSDPNLIYPLVASFRRRLAAFELCSATEEVRVSIALEEALLNALYHGNLELTASELEQVSDDLVADGFSSVIDDRMKLLPFNVRRIHVRAKISRDEAVFVIRDEGRGFEVDRFVPLVIDDELVRPSGRGLALIYSFMDAVFHNDCGNEVTLVKRRPAA
jgi:anti-sigma regulatory factor (Ser/Thr protein kinase)